MVESLSHMFTALLVIGILVLLIVIHELGHFIVAKIFGVRVEEFGIGYPPRAFSFGTWGGTEYTLNWIPFGGFVRLFGDEGEKQHGRGSYVDAHRGVQALILVAGVLGNALLAWALFAGALHLGIPRVVDEVGPGVHLVISDVVPGSPADAAGIAAGDEIVGMGDLEGNLIIDTFTPETVSAFVSTRGGQPIEVSFLRAGTVTTATVIPAHAVILDEASRPALGVALVLVSTEAVPWGEAMKDALTTTRNAFVMIGGGLWNILKDIARGAPNLSDVVGPIGLVGVVGTAAQNGFGNVLALAAFISVNLAIINLIPIPALDGGRLLILAVESLRRRDAPRLAIQLLNALGVALIALLMITVTYHDIARLLA